MNKAPASVNLPEQVTLPDGGEVVIRPVMPDDRGLFLAAWERVSKASRQRRFLGPKAELTEEELDFYTQVDGHNHIAIGAVALDQHGQASEGVAVARIIRADDEPDAGELGILVVDAWQGRGVGRALMPRLLKLAAAEGIRRVRAQAWSDNEPIQRLLQQYPHQVLTRYREGEMRVELDLQALGPG